MKLSEEAKDVIVELFNTGVGRAAASLSELLMMEIHLTVPVLELVSFEELHSYLPSNETDEFVVTTQSFSGGLEGKGIVSFPVTKGKTLVNWLLEEDGNSEETLNVLELEAIAEVGNLLVNAIGSTIADMIDTEIQFYLPSTKITPYWLNPAEETPGNTYVIGQTNFSVETGGMQGMIIFVFSYGNIEKIIEKIII